MIPVYTICPLVMISWSNPTLEKMRMKKLPAIFALTALGGLAAAQPSVAPAPGELRISQDSLVHYVQWLSDDAREGRGTGEPGCEAAASWLAQEV